MAEPTGFEALLPPIPHEQIITEDFISGVIYTIRILEKSAKVPNQFIAPLWDEVKFLLLHLDSPIDQPKARPAKVQPIAECVRCARKVVSCHRSDCPKQIKTGA
jgi:hypothetical protein